MSTYWARNPIIYNGHNLDRGQVFEFGGQRNDEKLERLRYVLPVEDGSETYTCAECNGEFIEQTFRTAHGDRAHPKREFTEQELDRLLDRQDREMTQIYPLALEKTFAAQHG